MTRKAITLRVSLLAIIILSGAVLRYAFNLETVIDNPIRGDGAYYVIYANNLLEYSTFSKDKDNIPPVPDSYWSPGYPAFLALMIKASRFLGINNYNLVLSSQLVLGLLTILLCYQVSKSLLPGYWPLLPAGLAAASPHLVSLGQLLLSETLFGFLMLASVYALIRGLGTKRDSWIYTAGGGFALTYLVNPVSLFLAPLLALMYVWQAAKTGDAPRATRLVKAIMIMGPVIIVATAWSVRNAISVPETSPGASDRLLTNLIIGMQRDYHSVWRANMRDPNNPATLDADRIQGSYSNFLRVLAARTSAQPASMMKWYGLQKPYLLWDWDMRVGLGDIYIFPIHTSLYHNSKPALLSYIVMRATHFWLITAAILGTIFLFRKNSDESANAAMIYGCLFYVSLVYVVTQAEPRYSIPLRSELYICATYFLWNTVESYKRFKGKPPAAI